jgi:hypothetical protein
MMRGRGGAENSDDGAPPALLSCDAPQDGQVDAPGEALEEAVEGVPQPDGRGELSHAAGRGGGGGLGEVGECTPHGLRAGDEGRRARGPHAAVDVADAAELVEDVREDEICARGDGRWEEERGRGGQSGPANLGGTGTCCSGRGRGAVSSSSPRTVRRRHHGRGRGAGRGEGERSGQGGRGRGGRKGVGGRRFGKRNPAFAQNTSSFTVPRPRRWCAPRPRGQMEDPSLCASEVRTGAFRAAHGRRFAHVHQMVRPPFPLSLPRARTRATPPRAPLGMMRNTL